MSTLSQFFGSGGGGSSVVMFPVRVQILKVVVEPGYVCHCWTNLPNNSTYCLENRRFLVKVEVIDLNLKCRTWFDLSDYSWIWWYIICCPFSVTIMYL